MADHEYDVDGAEVYEEADELPPFRIRIGGKWHVKNDQVVYEQPSGRRQKAVHEPDALRDPKRFKRTK
ncbi:hypothetical protein ACFQ1S_20955 [Kibdelosporangium lantanae]|uniref:Uncharacterized protein n=1 Tax=Kibdelosporangium lantanae TaxID=1497396 RepID=A0ABW3MB33_9PSEU